MVEIKIEKEQLTSLYFQPGHLLRRAHQIAASIFIDELEGVITPVQYAVLAILRDNPGIDQVTLAGLVAIDTSTAASVAIRLEEKKLLTRDLDPNNRRQRALHLTKAGEDLLFQVVDNIYRLENRIFAGLSQDEAGQFMGLLQKLVDSNNSLSRAPLLVPEDKNNSKKD